MATDPSAALDTLIAAFRSHLAAATAEHDPDADAVLDAAAVLADAFDAYDEALYEETGVDTPLYLDDDSDDDDEDDFDDDDLEGDEDDSDDESDDDDLDGDEDEDDEDDSDEER
ncbi:DNA primase [Pseudactinotalea terrae]|uniref:DNA primase n=1 Tax=Pseudactinotalea terrae TaxID=1743262 RepID=UPI0012E25BC8|nr:DNA primase [Pseudactinotalea terrae]